MNTFWRKIAVTAGCIVLWRLMAAIPIPIVALGLAHPDLHRTSAQGALALLAGQPLEPVSIVAMGLGPFLDAFVLFWLLGIFSKDAWGARTNPSKVWPYLAWLTLGLAALRAFGLTNLLLEGHRAALTSGAGLSTIFALILGSMALLGFGRLIDRFGIPAGYGLWFLFGVGSLLKGVHALAVFIDADAGDRLPPAILVAYALLTALLLASTVVVFVGFHPVPLHRVGEEGSAAGETTFPLHILLGGFIVPVVVAATGITLPLLISGLVGGVPATQVPLYWSPLGPNIWVDVGYNAVFSLLVIAACFFTMYVNSNTTAAAEMFHKDGYLVPGVPPGIPTARYLTLASTSVTAIGAVWMALVVVLSPLAMDAVLGHSRPRLALGGGPFVITAAVLINAAKTVGRGG